jgi:VWFA-related protein
MFLGGFRNFGYGALLASALFGTVSGQPCGKSSSPLVQINLSVWDPKTKNFLEELTSNDLEIVGGKQTYAVASTTRNDQPLTIGILIDTSGSTSYRGSTKRNEIPVAAETVREFIIRSDPRNRYFIVKFAAGVDLVTPTTQDRPRIEAALGEVAKLKPGGNTSFFDAVSRSLEYVAKSAVANRVLIILSDAADTGSRHNDLEKIRRLARQQGDPIYLVNLVRDEERLDSNTGGSGNNFDDTAIDTGGRVFNPSTKEEMRTALHLIAEELRNRYSVGFCPPLVSEKKWNKIRVVLSTRLSNRKQAVLAPRGYFH